MPEYAFTTDWVSSHEPHWRTLFTHLVGQPNVRFVEVGSYEGRSSVWWLKNVLTHPTSQLTCIDLWQSAAERERRFDANLVGSGRSNQVKKIKAESARALSWLPLSSFDAAYVDGSHEAADVLLDGLLCLRLLKPGGILLFDDYRWQGDRHHLPAAAIDAVVVLTDFETEVIHSAYQPALCKK